MPKLPTKLSNEIGQDWVVLDLNYTRKRKPKGDRK